MEPAVLVGELAAVRSAGTPEAMGSAALSGGGRRGLWAGAVWENALTGSVTGCYE